MWWLLVLAYTASCAAGIVSVALDPRKGVLVGLALWLAVGGRLLYEEWKYAPLMRDMLLGREAAKAGVSQAAGAAASGSEPSR